MIIDTKGRIWSIYPVTEDAPDDFWPCWSDGWLVSLWAGDENGYEIGVIGHSDHCTI